MSSDVASGVFRWTRRDFIGGGAGRGCVLKKALQEHDVWLFFHIEELFISVSAVFPGSR